MKECLNARCRKGVIKVKLNNDGVRCRVAVENVIIWKKITAFV